MTGLYNKSSQESLQIIFFCLQIEGMQIEGMCSFFQALLQVELERVIIAYRNPYRGTQEISRLRRLVNRLRPSPQAKATPVGMYHPDVT